LKHRHEVVRREVVSRRIYQPKVLVVMYWKRGQSGCKRWWLA
jgi:hypothetical protein